MLQEQSERALRRQTVRSPRGAPFSDYTPAKTHEKGKMHKLCSQKMAMCPIAYSPKIWYHFSIPVEYAYSTKIGIGH